MKKKEKDTKWKEERITGNVIGAEGAKTLCDALKVNTTLKTLNLWGEELRKEKDEKNGEKVNDRQWDWR